MTFEEPDTAAKIPGSRSVTRIEEPMHWNTIAQGMPDTHVLQSWEWGAFKSRHGWSPTRLHFDFDGQPGVASVLRRQITSLPFSILYVPKGPLINYDDPMLVGHMLHELEILARNQRAIFIKIDPDVPANHLITTELLRKRGWLASQDQIQLRNTLHTDLRPDPKAILQAMKSKTRYNIRYARRNGITIRPSSDLRLFYDMYAETAERDGFLIRPFNYYEDAWGSFIETGMAQLFLASYENEALAGLIPYRFGDTAWYMYGASRTVHRQLMPTYLLQWEVMLWARDAGCVRYDWWGAPDQLDESDPMWGVYRFKSGFASDFVEQIGAWDYPVSRALYWMYMKLMPAVLGVGRRLHRP